MSILPPAYARASARFRTGVVLSILICGCAAPTLAWAGTGAGLQVPNPPTGRFSQPGAPGFCQCIKINTERPTICIRSAAQCEALCGRSYAYLPDAGLSCPATEEPDRAVARFDNRGSSAVQ